MPLQLNIYDAIPGQEAYSLIWRLNFVIVPRSYVANIMRSAEQALTSGDPIIHSDQYVN